MWRCPLRSHQLQRSMRPIPTGGRDLSPAHRMAEHPITEATDAHCQCACNECPALPPPSGSHSKSDYESAAGARTAECVRTRARSRGCGGPSQSLQAQAVELIRQCTTSRPCARVHNHSGRFGKAGRRPIACARLEVSAPQGRRRVFSSTVIQSHVKSSWTSTHTSRLQPGQGQHEQTSKSSWARSKDHTVRRRDDCIPAQQLADDAAVPFAQKYYMQSLFPQALILDYSYSRGVRRNCFPITVTASVAARNCSKYSYCQVAARKDRT